MMDKFPISMEKGSVDQDKDSTLQYHGNSDKHRGSWEKEKGANTQRSKYTNTRLHTHQKTQHNTERSRTETTPLKEQLNILGNLLISFLV